MNESSSAPTASKRSSRTGGGLDQLVQSGQKGMGVTGLRGPASIPEFEGFERGVVVRDRVRLDDVYAMARNSKSQAGRQTRNAATDHDDVLRTHVV